MVTHIVEQVNSGATSLSITQDMINLAEAIKLHGKTVADAPLPPAPAQ